MVLGPKLEKRQATTPITQIYHGWFWLMAAHSTLFIVYWDFSEAPMLFHIYSTPLRAVDHQPWKIIMSLSTKGNCIINDFYHFNGTSAYEFQTIWLQFGWFIYVWKSRLFSLAGEEQSHNRECNIFESFGFALLWWIIGGAGWYCGPQQQWSCERLCTFLYDVCVSPHLLGLSSSTEWWRCYMGGVAKHN